MLFGTDGIRGTVGIEPLTSRSLEKLGRALAIWMQEKYGANPSVLLAHDTRLSCDFVKTTLKSGMLAYPVKIFDANILPTAAVVQLLHYHSSYQVGIIISASHNPYEDNGIKIVEGKLGKISQNDEERITTLFHQELPFASYGSLGRDFYYNDAPSQYSATITSFFSPNFLKGKKIVLDCAHGAASFIAPSIFQTLGAEVIVLNAQPDGFNINKNCGALHPQRLQEKVIEHQADAGFSFDGDADRVIAVNRLGQIKDGDDLLALLLSHPRYRQETAVVGTIMSNQGLEQHLHHMHRQLFRASVGDKYVAQLMNAHNVSLGGEPSGHLIARDYLMTGDGIFIALLVCQTMDLINCWQMQSFAKFPQLIFNVTIRCRRDLNEPSISQIINKSKSLLHQGRLIVRYSGTELLLRIMVEDDSYENAHSIGLTLSQQLKELFI